MTYYKYISSGRAVQIRLRRTGAMKNPEGVSHKAKPL
jgi:hypothetical protein